MLPFVGRWVKTTVPFIPNNQHFPLHHSNSWELYHSCCPSQGIFPPSAIQTLISLSGNNWSVGWSCYPASLYWMSVVHEHWSLCRYARDASYISSYALCGVSLLTMTAISVDRLLAMLLGLRYREIVTLRRTHIILAIVWVVCVIAGLFTHLSYRISLWCSFIITPSCLVIPIASYANIFRALSHHQAQIQNHVQQQPSQPSALNMARYRKAVYSALWVQLALVVCYIPQFTVEIRISLGKNRFSKFSIINGVANVLVLFNSALNPFLYCWNISEVRRAVKQTIRQAICYA